jgi:TetR/AcrR family transcriptional regulator, lmrAB and yxaGH operons repressor
MPRPASTPREEVISRMKRVFRASGYEGASLASLAAETGLAKAALYHYFPAGKEGMASAVLDDLRAWTVNRILEPLSQPGEPRAKLVAMAAALDELYAGGHEACLIGLFSIGEALAHFQARLQVAVRDLIAAIGGVLREAGFAPHVAQTRAEDAVVRIQGALVVSRALHDSSLFTRLLQRLPAELLAPAPPH